MRRGGYLLLILITLIFIKSCADSSGDAREVVEEFLEEVREGEGMEAIKYLHPSYRDSLAKDLKLPIQFAEIKSTELLACALSTIGGGVKEVEVKDTEMVGDKTALVKVRIEEKEEIERILTFVVMKDANKWYIVDIASFVPSKR